MGFGGFIFSEDTSDLSNGEYQLACRTLDAISRIMVERTRLAITHPDQAKIFMPDEGWHPESQPSFELDGSTQNAQTSYELLAEKDRDIIRKMRLYSHAFTGYQLATLEFAAQRPWVSDKLPEDWDNSLRRLAGPPDQSVFEYVKVASALPRHLRITPPMKFGEIGWLWDGKIVNYDTASYLERICLLEENGILRLLASRQNESGIVNIVEIGGGYGGLAYFLSVILGKSIRYTIIDIPESLAFSATYLSILFPQADHKIYSNNSNIPKNFSPGYGFLPNMFCSSWSAGTPPVDLVINTLSLSEMSDRQIEEYCKDISNMIGTSGIFFEQNHQLDHRGPGGIPPSHFKLLRKCHSDILTDTYPQKRGQANLWVNQEYKE